MQDLSLTLRNCGREDFEYTQIGVDILLLSQTRCRSKVYAILALGVCAVDKVSSTPRAVSSQRRARVLSEGPEVSHLLRRRALRAIIYDYAI
jgi:hypothetical protein